MVIECNKAEIEIQPLRNITDSMQISLSIRVAHWERFWYF